jgi:acetyl-CoA carboxylase biotin carboxyl carrier protein
VPLTAKDVAEITRLLEQSDFLELRLEHEGFKITLRRAGARDPATESATRAVVSPAAPAPPTRATAAALPEEPRGEALPARDPSLIDVSAPLLGIFYRAPRPGAAPYVEVGAEVEADSIVGIIEVMKLMNSVRAEVRGRVVEILAEDGAAVEAGQVLLRVARGGGDG